MIRGREKSNLSLLEVARALDNENFRGSVRVKVLSSPCVKSPKFWTEMKRAYVRLVESPLDF